MARIIILSISAVLLIAALIFANHYVPFQIEVVVVYLGIIFFIAGLLSLIKPFKFIYIKNRKTALLLTVAGILVFILGTMLPAPLIHSSRSHQRIDDFMPEYQFYEYHEVIVNAPAETAARAMKEVSFADIPVAVWLMKIRAMASGEFKKSPPKNTESNQGPFSQPILKLFAQPGNGFLVLDDEIPYEYVGGMAGKPWSNDRPPDISGPDEFRTFNMPGNIKVAFNLHVVDMENGTSRLSSETRIVCIDESARRLFSRYWRIIYPGSAIIRRVWLNAIVERAARH